MLDILSVPSQFKAKITIDEKGCWIWLGGTGARGRPFVSYKGTSYYLHIILYKLLVGEIPAGLILRHTCDVILCVNPEHLLTGTRKDNMHDMYNRGIKSNKKLPQFEVEKLRNGEITKQELRAKYGLTMKYLNNVLLGFKRQIVWDK